MLEWDAVTGSVGVQLKVYLPSGSVFIKRFGGIELDQFFVPYAFLGPGTYLWNVQAACSTIPPYSVTNISATSSFTIGESGTCPPTVTDFDGNIYSTILIGSQCWMSENLLVEHYRNGDVIPSGFSDSMWIELTDGASAVYNNDPVNKPLYGLLYNWFAVDDGRGLCPLGWHVPTEASWTQLTDFLGGVTVAGGKLKATGTLSTGTGLWFIPNTAATNSSGFSAVPGGFRDDFYGFTSSRGNAGFWWSSTEVSPGVNKCISLNNTSGTAFLCNSFSKDGFSIRCLKD